MANGAQSALPDFIIAVADYFDGFPVASKTNFSYDLDAICF